MILGRKNQYCENEYTAKCNLQIQCDPYHITNGIFHTIRTKNFIVCIETQKTLNRQSSLEKEEWGWRNQSSWLQIILQSYIYKDSIVLAETQKYKQMEQDKKPSNKPMHLWVPYFWKKARTYDGAKTTFSINGAGKTGQLHVNQLN